MNSDGIDSHQRLGKGEQVGRPRTFPAGPFRRAPGYTEDILDALPWETRCRANIASLAQGLGLTAAMVEGNLAWLVEQGRLTMIHNPDGTVNLRLLRKAP